MIAIVLWGDRGLEGVYTNSSGDAGKIAIVLWGADPRNQIQSPPELGDLGG